MRIRGTKVLVPELDETSFQRSSVPGSVGDDLMLQGLIISRELIINQGLSLHVVEAMRHRLKELQVGLRLGEDTLHSEEVKMAELKNECMKLEVELEVSVDRNNAVRSNLQELRQQLNEAKIRNTRLVAEARIAHIKDPPAAVKLKEKIQQNRYNLKQVQVFEKDMQRQVDQQVSDRNEALHEAVDNRMLVLQESPRSLKGLPDKLVQNPVYGSRVRGEFRDTRTKINDDSSIMAWKYNRSAPKTWI